MIQDVSSLQSAQSLRTLVFNAPRVLTGTLKPISALVDKIATARR